MLINPVILLNLIMFILKALKFNSYFSPSNLLTGGVENNEYILERLRMLTIKCGRLLSSSYYCYYVIFDPLTLLPKIY